MKSRFHYLILSLVAFAFGVTVNAPCATPGDTTCTHFSFAVMGDPQPEEPPAEEPQAFRESLRDMRLLKPDAIMILGDLIRGFTDDSLLLRKEWEGFLTTIRGFENPFFYAVGNHDIWDEQSQKEYLGHFGRLYGSSSVGSVHFICLNSFELGNYNRISREQLQWLKSDLEAHRSARHIFVGVHAPLWAFGSASNWMDEVHPLLTHYNVRAVFAGHWHIYQRSDVMGGIRYYITGGAGGLMPESSDGTGDFHHYMMVSIRGDSVSYAVMRPGSVLGDDFVTRQSAAFFLRLSDEAVGDPRLVLGEGSGATTTISVPLNNVFHKPLRGRVRWLVTQPRFTLDRYEQEFSLSPGARETMRFVLSAGSGNTSAFLAQPRPRLECTLSLGDSAIEPPLAKELVVVRTVSTVQPGRRITVDGDLAEWPDSWPVRVAAREQVTLVPERWTGPQESSGEFALALGDSEIFFGGRVVDPDVFHARREAEPYQADAVSLYIDARDSLEFQRRLFTGGISLAVFAPESDVHQKAYWISVYPYDRPMKGIRFASRRTPDGYTVEASIPLREIPGLRGKGQTVGLDVCIDNLEANGNRTRMLWNGIWANFMYGNRYGRLHLR